MALEYKDGETYVGLMEVIFLSLLLLTHSLLINKPVGWVYFLPLGAVSSTDKSDILCDMLNNLRGNLGAIGIPGERDRRFGDDGL